MRSTYHLRALILSACVSAVVTLAVLTVTACAPSVPSGAWTKRTVVGDSPSPRFGQSMASVSPSTIILFGGVYGETLGSTWKCLQDTWAYDTATNTWQELEVAGPIPLPRFGQAMVFDPDAGKVLMFGGRDDSDADLADLWQFDLATRTWEELQPVGDRPQGSWSQTMIYDPRAHRALLLVSVLDQVRVNGSLVLKSLNELWAYDSTLSEWTQLEPTGDRPEGRLDASMVYDSETGQALLFGGLLYALELDPPLDPPSDSSEPTVELHDLWAYDSQKNRWENLKPGGDKPTLGQGYLAYDSIRHQTLFLGIGATPAGEPLSRMWLYEAQRNRWTEIHPPGGFPPGRVKGSLVFSPHQQEIILYGGMTPEHPDEPLNQAQKLIYFEDVWTYR